ncbi:hypothetical protein K432DRAFT_405440 [Lepidopterella palustris CBS 459.81]|uniref:IPT/TIG domain-containing protein n=1 Tax=Lepidopterella palustris CBS 459.81 TaxID=1314670 RepID=A0A8E2JEN3_9PEZI|nr:hypothetical protein K432DRAFT_405440 [Lepidopterella palustris CBS 459.81]
MADDLYAEEMDAKSWEDPDQFTLFDSPYNTITDPSSFTTPNFFNETFIPPATPETPMYVADAKSLRLHDESGMISRTQPSLKPRSVDGGSSASPESSIQDSSSDSSRSRKRKTSPIDTLGNNEWDGGQDVKNQNVASLYVEQQLDSIRAARTERDLDSIGTKMETIRAFSGPNSPTQFGSGFVDPPLEQTISPSKLQHDLNARDHMSIPLTSGFHIGADSRDGSPSMIVSQENSPSGYGNQTPSPIANENGSARGNWNQGSAGFSWTENHTSPVAGMSLLPFGHSPVSPYGLGNSQNVFLDVGCDITKSRVETQINIRLTLCPLPQGVTTLHLPTNTISKAKLLATDKDKEKYGDRLETLELHTMLVCASAMLKPGRMDQALRRAAGSEAIPKRRPSSDSNSGSEDDNDPGHPLNGGPVRICANCINRERKRASRKRIKKQEDEETWHNLEAERVIVFNDKEYKDWEDLKLPKDGMHTKAFPPEAKQIDVPMRIACYCRHQQEKIGFQVIFTIKNFRGVVLAQQITKPILITDDHKTQGGIGSASAVSFRESFGELRSYPMGQAQEMFDTNQPDIHATDRGVTRSRYSRPYRSTTDLQGMQQVYQSPFLAQHSFGQTQVIPSHPMSASMTPRNISRTASPSAQTGPNKKRKPSTSASGHRKVPSTLNMTRMDNVDVPGVPGGGAFSAGASGAPPSFHASSGSYNMSPQSSMPTAMAMPGMAGSGAHTSGMATPATRTTSYENLAANGGYFSAPSSAHQSRTGSPISSSRPLLNAFQNQPFQTLGTQFPSPTNHLQDLPPAINKVIPGEGPQSGGIEVTCLGRGFYNGVEVMFGDRLATTTTFWGPSTLVCLVPPSVHPGLVSVTLSHKPGLGYSTLQVSASETKFKYNCDEERALLELLVKSLGRDHLENQITTLRRWAAGYDPNGYNSFDFSGSSPGAAFVGQRQFRELPGRSPGMDTEELLLKILDMIDMDENPCPPDFNVQLKNGSTMLSMACSLGYIRFVAGLLARGADPDTRDKGGFTPLMMAAMHGHAQIVRRLILRGADPMLRSLRGYLAEDLAATLDVAESLRRSAHHSRTRSSGALSLRSRASSVTSARSLWEGPSHTPVSAFSSAMSVDMDDSNSNDEFEDSEGSVSPQVWIQSRRNSTTQQSQHNHSATLQSEPQPPISPTAIFNWGNQLAAQFHQFQQNVNWNLPTIQLPPMHLPDYQTYPMVRRISSLVPHRVPLRNDSSSSEATIIEEPGWRNYIPFSAPSPSPPAYDHLYPDHNKENDIVKKLNNVAESLLDQKTVVTDATVGEASSSAATQRTERLDVRIGRKPLSKEKQEEIREVHAQQLKQTPTDRNLWFFWLPLLLTVVMLILYTFVPSWFSSLSTVASSVRVRALERIVELA